MTERARRSTFEIGDVVKSLDGREGTIVGPGLGGMPEVRFSDVGGSDMVPPEYLVDLTNRTDQGDDR